MKKRTPVLIVFLKTHALMCKASLLVLVLCLADAKTINAQDVSYSQFFNNPVYYNPAFTGLNHGLRARLHHRNQWNGLPNNYNNYAFILDVAERSIPGMGGLGLIVQSDFDGIGNIKTTSAAIAPAVRIPVSDNIITQVGVAISYIQKTIDYDHFIFTDQLDPRHGVVSESNFIPPMYNVINYPDFSFGGLVQTYNSSQRINHIISTLSFAMHHAFKPDVSFTGNDARLPFKFVFSGNVLLDNETARNRHSRRATERFFFKLNPGVLYETQGTMSNFIVGTNAYKNFLYGGVWLRSQSFTYARVNDLIMLAGVQLPLGDDARLKFMYSYDYVISDARRAVGSSHEITLVFEFDNFSLFGQEVVTGRNSIGCPHCPPF